MLKNIVNKAKGFLNRFKNCRKGSAEIIGLVLILIFVILVAAPKIKDLGATMSNGVQDLNTQMQNELNE